MSAMHDRIVALHGRHVLKRSILSIREGAGVMEHFMAGRGVRTALEIGTYRGVGAAEISQFSVALLLSLGLWVWLLLTKGGGPAVPPPPAGPAAPRRWRPVALPASRDGFAGLPEPARIAEQ